MNYSRVISAMELIRLAENDDYDETELFKIMDKIWVSDPKMLLKLIFYTRDPRNGIGMRDFTYTMLKYLKTVHYDIYKLNIKTIALSYGRLEDLLVMTSESDDLELQIFAEILQEDLQKENPSLAVKWAPREKGKYSDLSLRLAKILFPNDKKCSEKYRKTILAPLSKKVQIVEQLMTAGKWNEINYALVPSGAMKIYGKGAFMTHDKERYKNYLASMSLKRTLFERHSDDDIMEIYNKANVKSSIAVINTLSPIAITLGLAISKNSPTPFTNKFITFSDEPVIKEISGESLYEKKRTIMYTKSDQSVNIKKVCELLVNIPEESSIQNIHVFTEGQPYNVPKDITKRLFVWALEDNRKIFPIKQVGNVTYINGKSEELLNMFIEGCEMTPDVVLEKLLEKYPVEYEANIMDEYDIIE
jgi:hypothetical protein